jgi:hypothetical protein
MCELCQVWSRIESEIPDNPAGQGCRVKFGRFAHAAIQFVAPPNQLFLFHEETLDPFDQCA